MAISSAIRPYLEDLERAIDESVEAALYADWQRFADGRHTATDIFSPRRRRPLAPMTLAWPKVLMNPAFEDFDLMAVRELAGCRRLLAEDGGSPLSVRCNYGTGIMPSLFGAAVYMMDASIDEKPTTRHLAGGLDRIRRLVDGGVPDVAGGLGERVWAMAERFLEIEIGRAHV